MGIYSSLEDKYYSVLEKVDKFLPVFWLTDKIDKVFPSFILLLLVLLIIIGFFIAPFLIGSLDPRVDVEITVTNSAGNPIEGANVSVTQFCSSEVPDVSLLTNADGKISFTSCSEEINVSVSKENYVSQDKSINLLEEGAPKIILAPITIPVKSFLAKVIDSAGKVIPEAKLSLICIAGTKVTSYDINQPARQPTTGINFTIPSNCNTVKLKATSPKHKEKTITLLLSDTEKEIVLEDLMLKGKIFFTITNAVGAERNAAVTITDEFNREESLLAAANGQANFEEKEPGLYKYIVFARGYSRSDTFELNSGEIKDISILFNELLTSPDSDSGLGSDWETGAGNARAVFLKAVDGTAGIISDARIFYSKGADVNFLANQSSKQDGTIGPIQIVDQARKYYSIIKSVGYKTILVEAEQRKKADGPQLVAMQQGGAKLKVTVVDDQNKPLSGITTLVYLQNFAQYFDKALPTDSNGVTYFSGLPQGTYKLFGSTSTEEGTIEGLSIDSTQKEVTLRLLTGRGGISFNLYSDFGRANASCKLFTKNNSGGFTLKNSGDSIKNEYTVASLPATSMVQLRINDENFIPYEGLAYTITRAAQERNIFLRAKDNLPNKNEVQLILRQIYSGNPLNGKETVATQLIPGKSYFILFDAIINSDEDGDFVANFYVGPADKNALSAINPLVIDAAYSIPSSATVLANTMQGSQIDASVANPHIVDSRAKQLNLLVPEQQGEKVFPVILEVSVDGNATGQAQLFWEATFNDKRSLSYKWFAGVGEAFCAGIGKPCPAFLFNNYIKWADRNYRAVDVSDVTVLQIDDTYILKTIVESLSDKEIGDVSLTQTVEKYGFEYLSFFGDKNSLSRSISLGPLEKALPKEFPLIPKKPAYGAAKVYQSVQKFENGYDSLVMVNSDKQYLRFSVKNKEKLLAILVATGSENMGYEKETYPFVLIKTMYYPKVAVSANWKIYLEGQEGNPIKTGKTDENGLQITNLDLSNVTRTDKLFLKAEDENGSIPIVREITVTNILPDEPPLITECVRIRIAGLDINTFTDPKLTLDVTEKGTIVIKSECADPRKVSLSSDLELSMKQFDLPAGAEQAITITPAPGVERNNGLLGAYPLLVTAVNDESVTRAGWIDIIVKDSTSCFDLEKAIYDLTATDRVSGKINNKCFSGRKDNFYPKLDISTNSVVVAYKKPGNPEEINFTAAVIGSEIESFVQSTIGSSVLYVKAEGGKQGTQLKPIEAIPVPGSEAGDLNCISVPSGAMVARYYDGELTPKPEPDLNITNPTRPLYRLPVPSDWKASSIGGLASENSSLAKIKFAEVNSDKFPYSPFRGDYGTFFTGTTTLPDYYPFNPGADDWTAGDFNEQSRLHIGADGGYADWNAYYTANPTCDAINCDTIYQQVANSLNPQDPTYGQSYLGNNPPGLHRLFRSFTHTIDYLGWPVFLWDNENTEGASASGDLGVMQWPFLTCDGSNCVGSDGKLYDMSSPERWYLNAPIWWSLVEAGGVCYSIQERGLNGDSAQCGPIAADGTSNCMLIKGASLGSGKYYFQIKVVPTNAWRDSSRVTHLPLTGTLKVQFEAERGSEVGIERRQVWTTPATVKAIEGIVQRIGRYSAVPTPVLTSITKSADGLAPGEGFAYPLSYYTVGDIHPNGFVNPERAYGYNEGAAVGCVLGDTECEQTFEWSSFGGKSKYTPWIIRPPEDPLVEYSSDGKIMYYIPQDTIPGWTEGKPQLRMFLKGGTVYAEYLGVPEIASPNIDFNITKVNLLGQEYAIVTVADWIDGERKEIKAFQVKLKGNPSNCYFSDGTPGITGKEFAPKLLFNWDWNAIKINQCDATNPGYTYCDATQFTISLFRKIKQMNELRLAGKEEEMPKYTGFYAYLIKDNYSQEFLNDFDEYFSSVPFSDSTFFNSTGLFRGYDQFITVPSIANGNRIKFNIKNENGDLIPGGELPHGGLYRVELMLNYDNDNIASFFDNNSPNVSVDVVFKYEQPPKNNNPFYETPFDGEIGKKGNVYERQTYGASINAGELKLNPGTKIFPYSNPLVQVNYLTSEDLVTLNNRIVLSYAKNTNNLYLIPATITPVTVSITSTNGKAKAQYQLTGVPSANNVIMKWKLIGSTVASEKCLDFTQSNERLFTEAKGTNGLKTLSWNGTKPGALTLATAFFVPQKTQNPIKLESKSNVAVVNYNSYSVITNPASIQLNNQIASDNYDSLQKIFDSVANKKMCMTQNSEANIKVWWNPDYVDTVIKQLGGSTPNCK